MALKSKVRVMVVDGTGNNRTATNEAPTAVAVASCGWAMQAAGAAEEQQQDPAAAAAPRRGARVRTRTAPRTEYGAFSAADALAMRGEAPQVVAAARAAAAERNLAQRASRHSASVEAFAATRAVVEAGEAAESAARADADWRPGGPRMLELARQPRDMGA